MHAHHAPFRIISQKPDMIYFHAVSLLWFIC